MFVSWISFRVVILTLCIAALTSAALVLLGAILTVNPLAFFLFGFDWDKYPRFVLRHLSVAIFAFIALWFTLATKWPMPGRNNDDDSDESTLAAHFRRSGWSWFGFVLGLLWFALFVKFPRHAGYGTDSSQTEASAIIEQAKKSSAAEKMQLESDRGESVAEQSRAWSANTTKPTPAADINPDATGARYGMTWGVAAPTVGEPLVTVGCGAGVVEPMTRLHTNQCNPYQGDTLCSQRLPALCVLASGKEIREIKTTIPVPGEQFATRKDADTMCAALGPAWRIVTHHDGPWKMTATASQPLPASRFWVAIDDQPGNCWKN